MAAGPTTGGSSRRGDGGPWPGKDQADWADAASRRAGYSERVFDIGALEFVVLAVAALFIFGPDRLPDIARQAARGLRQVRSMATNARRELTRELGPEFEDLDIRDLNPRSFVRKHVLDGLDEDDLRFDRDLDLSDDLRIDDEPSRTSVNGSTNGAESTSESGTDDETTEVPADDGAPSASASTEGTGDASTEGPGDVEADTSTEGGAVATATATAPPYDTEAT